NDPAHCAQTITDLVAERLPNYYHFDILNDIQVLSPMHKGEVGISALNKLLQDRLNPFGQEIKRLEYTYRLNDKVMQIHNNYEKDVFNGDLGVISDIDTKERILRIRFEENKTVDYKFDELDDIIPAYAISIHKSQGSEYPCVVIPVSLTQYWMLERNLIYTGVTRGKKIVIVIGEQAAFVKAIQTNTMRKRFTRLELRLRLSQNCPDFLEKLNSYSVYNSKCNYEENDSDSDDEKCLLDILRF
ncbi:MAG: ATP-binding domain-containing protein, partial [Desulfovibrionaceae bacterium]|nr:ATP-binding domain-containing protein [Desulfovibrionaceae bacterium]